MSPQLAIRTSIVFGFLAWGAVTFLYIWPALDKHTVLSAVRPLLVPHMFRYIGLVFLVPGVVSPELPAAYARPAAYGDLISASLALAALGSLTSGWGVALVWLFNVWGTADLVLAFVNVFRQVRAGKLLAGHFGAAYFIPTFYVPLLLITHGLIFWLLI